MLIEKLTFLVSKTNTDFIPSFSFISSGDILGTVAASSASGAAPSCIHAERYQIIHTAVSIQQHTNKL